MIEHTNAPSIPETSKEESDSHNQLMVLRHSKLKQIRQDSIAFPNDFCRTHYALDLQKEYSEHTREQLLNTSNIVSIAGRILRDRGAFLVLKDMSGKIQLYVNRKTLPKETLTTIKDIDLGDIVGASGVIQRSGKGELYVDLQSFRLLSKSLRPLPDKHKGLTNTELRYRQRYVDLIINDSSKNIFEIRFRLINAMRQFFAKKRFTEVETPMLQVIPGGATARPFKTHHNSLDIDMYLRVAPELYLKRLVVGGMERIFEVNRNFRNEGLSTRHNPEFTMLEFYQAYATYKDLMDLTEELLNTIAQDVLNTTQLTYQNQIFDLGSPYARMTVLESIVHFNKDIEKKDLSTLENAKKVLSSKNINFINEWPLGKLQMAIFEHTVEEKLQQPTFITEYPADVSPLARRNDLNPFVTDRFEFFIGGKEIANGYSELNDPIDQAERFQSQVQEKDSGDLEAMHYDADYIRALEYGMPPTAGEGIGIDRLVMLYTNATSIKDVILFPHMRPEHSET